MKKVYYLLLALCLIFSLSACGTNENNIVSKAVSVLKNHWEAVYDEPNLETDGYFEIKNTRVINIKENTTEEFKNIDYIVEFVLYTDYYGSAPYYQIVGIDDTVVVYKNGTMKVQRKNLINRYRDMHYINDFSDFIKSIDDYGDKYNCIEYLKPKKIKYKSPCFTDTNSTNL